MSLPTTMGALVRFTLWFLIYYFSGMLGDPYVFSGIGISNILINGLWYTTIYGMNGAMTTLVS